MKACSSTKGKLRKKERKVGTATIIPPISNGFKKCGYPYVDSRQMATAVEDDNFANDVIAELHNLHIVDESYVLLAIH
ncbi:hypothetical protein PInf_011307 [Phytophthora infestans]|nr:hypothetical protein PInf_011307 [Phytophthora infestans]